MIMAQEEGILKAQSVFEELAAFVRDASTEQLSIDVVERELWDGVLRLALEFVKSFVASYRQGDVGATCEYDGRVLNRLESPHDRRYVSVFGELTISRFVYGTRETQKHEAVPLDAALGLPAGDFSYVLQDWDQAFCVQGSFDASRRTVERILGIGQSVRSLQHMNAAMAQSVEAFRESLPTPSAKEEGSILVLTADGKGVPMCRDREEDPPPVQGHRKKGEKANKKRMACVGAVYTVDKFKRTARDVVDEILRDKRRADRPVPQHKDVRAELTRVIDEEESNGKDRVFKWFAEQLELRNPNDHKAVVCVMDGERALWKLATKHVPNAIFILDLFHVLQRLWQAAHCFHPEGSKEANAFVADRLERILENGVGRVIGGLRQMATKHQLRGARKKQLNAVAGYLQNNREYMAYGDYLCSGFPIGSGVAEGACRHLVKDRMELAGMRWRTPGAQAMLDLRAVYLNGKWDAFQSARIEQEQRKLYPYMQLALNAVRTAA